MTLFAILVPPGFSCFLTVQHNLSFYLAAIIHVDLTLEVASFSCRTILPTRFSVLAKPNPDGTSISKNTYASFRALAVKSSLAGSRKTLAKSCDYVDFTNINAVGDAWHAGSDSVTIDIVIWESSYCNANAKENMVIRNVLLKSSDDVMSIVSELLDLVPPLESPAI